MSRTIQRAAWLSAVLLIIFGVFRFARHEVYLPVPSGGEFRLRDVAYTDHLSYTKPGLKLHGLRERLGPQLSRLLGPEGGTSTVGWGRRSLVVSFASRGRNGTAGLVGGSCEIDLPNGQILQRTIVEGHAENGTKVEYASFDDDIPFAPRRLKIRLELVGATHHFEVANPAFSKEKE